MRAVPIRRLLAKLAVIAVTASPALGDARPGPAAQVSIDDVELDARLPVDLERWQPHDAAPMLGRHLALALAEVRPLDATHLAASWSLSSDRTRRLAIANALVWIFPLVGDSVMIDHLSRDGDAAIRAATAHAAWARRAIGGDAGVLARLARDPDPEVRAIAHRAG